MHEKHPAMGCGPTPRFVRPLLYLMEDTMQLEEILLYESRLIPIINDAYHLAIMPTDIKNRYWYKILKPQMVKLVGFESDDDSLKSTEVYDMIYQFLIRLMGI